MVTYQGAMDRLKKYRLLTVPCRLTLFQSRRLKLTYLNTYIAEVQWLYQATPRVDNAPGTRQRPKLEWHRGSAILCIDNRSHGVNRVMGTPGVQGTGSLREAGRNKKKIHNILQQEKHKEE